MIRLRLIALFALVAIAPLSFAADKKQPPPPIKYKATSKEMEKYEQTAREVMKKLIANAKRLPKTGDVDVDWEKLKFHIVDYCEFGGDYDAFNAYANFEGEGDDRHPVVYLGRGYLDAIDGNEHGLALILGHELGHHALGHIKPRTIKTQLKATADGHRMEADADLFGAKLLLKANYSLKNAIDAKYAMMRRIEKDDPRRMYPSAHGSWCTHPGTTDRMARLAKLLTAPEEALWRCMSAFENGVYFLTIEDYSAAEDCFERVTKEFPDCAEAWANLGMARLHKYCDTLKPEELAKLDIGQFVAGVRFRFTTLTRVDPNKLFLAWKAAEGALKKSLQLKPGSATVLVGLGLAYLVCPERSDVRLQQADKCLSEAYRIAYTEASDLEPEALAALLINRGVVRMATGETDDGRGLIFKAQLLVAKIVKDKPYAANELEEMENAVLFNTAFALRADGKKSQAIAKLKQYLLTVPSSNPWWKVAYIAYTDLNMSLGEAPESETKLAQMKAPVRRQMAVKLANGKMVHVGESMKDVIDKLGKPVTTTSGGGIGLQSLSYPALGLTIIGDDEEVFGFQLSGPNAPVIVVKEKGINGKVLGEIRVGMTREQVAKLTGVTDWRPRNFTHLATSYSYSAGLGIALVFGKDGKSETVTSILVGSVTASVTNDGVVPG